MPQKGWEQIVNLVYEVKSLVSPLQLHMVIDLEQPSIHPLVLSFVSTRQFRHIVLAHARYSAVVPLPPFIRPSARLSIPLSVLVFVRRWRRRSGTLLPLRKYYHPNVLLPVWQYRISFLGYHNSVALLGTYCFDQGHCSVRIKVEVTFYCLNL